ncbi:cobalt-zinc-cadmium efflux system protein [Rhodoligotrophos appendicifer]|uniref:cation diffusion facilitator family transporter n=1 Tax=Rhodoligotrophos appendicifer TaxID=987056 RepID=UPI00118688F8|nr:cation diffusion facilitator family transporter [Rhodoligotrophos appendicifer]
MDHDHSASDRHEHNHGALQSGDHNHQAGKHIHGVGGHAHGANQRRTFWAALITVCFMVLELIGGLTSGSLALVADAAHMLTDSVSLGFAWFAFKLAARPSDALRSYGFDRLQIVVAYTNGVAMILVVVWIFVEAGLRLLSPEKVEATTMLWVAAAGLLANIGAFIILNGADRDNLNIRGALLHVLGDLLGSVAAIVAAIVILRTGWMPIDPLLSALVGLLLLSSAIRLVRDAGHILLEGVPSHLSADEIARDLCQSVQGVDNIHHVHIWALTSERPLITLHARLSEAVTSASVISEIKDRLKKKFGISHATIEIELESCADNNQPLRGC